MRWIDHVARLWKMLNVDNILIETPQRKRPVGRRGWEDNIKVIGKSGVRL